MVGRNIYLNELKVELDNNQLSIFLVCLLLGNTVYYLFKKTAAAAAKLFQQLPKCNKVNKITLPDLHK